ncbi:DUF11 domain-containing protein [Candidatus Dojkabacteria bacterium]|nr:DUF11 domain-containing protein [Candidatus Dojkabacteria bacterium]
MNKFLKSDLKTKIIAGCFVIGIILLIWPAQQKIEELPATGETEPVTIELTVDKQDVQRDDPSDNAQIVNYTITIRNNAECTPVPIDSILVFDKSGSMSSLMDGAKQAGITFVNNQDFSKDQTGIVAYDSSGYLIQTLTTSQTNLVNGINSISAGGLTNIGEGILLAKNELLSGRHNPQASQVMIIFTDGRANRPQDTTYAPQYALSQATLAKEAGIRIISIAYGSYSDTSLMQQIASPGSGNYYFAPTGQDMVNIYAAISEDLQGNSPDTQVSIDLTPFQNIIDLLNVSSDGIYTQGELIWNLGTLQCQESAFLEFSLGINNNAQDLDLLDLIATVSNSSGLSIVSSNVITTVHAPRLSISKTDHRDTAMPGDVLDYEISITNEGTGNAYGVTITDILPDNFFNLDINSISDNGQRTNGEILWDNGGNGYTLDGSFEPTGSPWINSLLVSFSGNVGADMDPGLYTLLNIVQLETANGFSDEAFDETDIPYAPDLSITKSSVPPVYTYPGGTVLYTITITNNGNIDATDVIVTDDFDELNISVNPEDGYVSNGYIVWIVGDLAVGESKIITYEALIDTTLPENTIHIPNESIVTLHEPDIDESDNIALHEVIATLNPVLDISKTSDKTTYRLGEEVEYTLAITNNSSADAYNLNLADLITKEFNYVSGSAKLNGVTLSNPEGTQNLIWDLGNLPTNQTIELVFRVRMNNDCVPGNYPNTGTITWEDEVDNPFGPLNASTTISIVEESTFQETTDLGVAEPETLVNDIITTAQVLGERLVKTGEALIYLKVLAGLLLALPLPLMLIFGSTSKKTPKKKRVKSRRKKSRKK